MKKSILILLLVIGGSISLFAQTTPSSDFKPGVGSFGFVASVDGLSNIKLAQQGTLGFRYVLAEGLVGRLNLNVTASHSSTTTNDSIAKTQTVSTQNYTLWALKLGIQKNFDGTARLEPYVGADIGIGNARSGNGGFKTDTKTTSTANSDYSEQIIKPMSGIGFSLVPFVGFNYYIAPRFALGAEFGWGLSIASTSGGSVENKSSSGGTTSDVTVTGNDKNSSLSLGSTGSASVSLTVWFK